jgi:Putative beta-barrel porin-2, OmpL-like. bbp2
MKTNRSMRIGAGLAAVFLLVSMNSFGEGPTNDELQDTIKKLEARLAELEAKVGKDATGAVPVAAGAIAPSEPAEKTAKAEPSPAETAAAGNGNANGNGFLKGLSWEAMVDGYYGYNFNKPFNRTNQLRNFDTNHNQFSLNLAEIVLQKKAEPFGFRFDLDFGPTTDLVHATEPGGVNTYRNIQQAFFTYVAPVGRGLTFDFGKFVTPHGAEVIESRDNFNYSRSLLFALAIPYYHFGLRMSYPVKDNFSVNFHLVNGWNNVVDNNTGKTLGLGFNWSPQKRVNWVFNYMAGPEQANNNSNWRSLWDTTVTVVANDKVTFMGNYDYGFERVSPNSFVHWTGVAGYMKIQANPWFAFGPRVEWFNDHDGFSTTLGQRVKDFTMTSEFRLHPNVITRLEYRRDWSNKEFFSRSDSGPLGKNQNTVLMGLIFTIGSPK